MSNSKEVVLALDQVNKTFVQGGNTIVVLENASLQIKAGEVVALIGPSGSGKTTLLQVAGLLDKVDSGNVVINGTQCANASDNIRTNLRRQAIGFVYQFHHLLPEFSALENVVIPQMVNGVTRDVAEKNAKEILKYLGLGQRTKHRPAKLSGGEQQRVAIARGVVNRPALLLADEPTGNLDPHTAKEVFDLLLKTAKDIGLAALVVTHNVELAHHMDRVVTLNKGAIVQKRRSSKS